MSRIENPLASRRLRRTRAAFACGVAILLAGCYPRYDWRDVRPDCARAWCGFVASFPGKITSATRDIPVGDRRLPLSLHVVSIGGVTFAIGAFALQPGDDPAKALETFRHKLLDDVGATAGRDGKAAVYTADRDELVADTFDVDGSRDGKALHATARFVRRRDRLVEILVIGPTEALSSSGGRQAIETFVTSVRLD